VAGEVSPLALDRLAEWATDADEPVPVHYRIEFLRPGADKLRLARISVETVVRLTCERCLEPMTLPLAGASTLQFVYSDDQAAQVGEAHEAVILDEEGMVSVAELIEEEVLMAMPVVARHEEPCRAPWRESVEDEAGDGADANPFAVLASLRKGSGEDADSDS